jgi:hypothetical protein
MLIPASPRGHAVRGRSAQRLASLTCATSVPVYFRALAIENRLGHCRMVHDEPHGAVVFSTAKNCQARTRERVRSGRRTPLVLARKFPCDMTLPGSFFLADEHLRLAFRNGETNEEHCVNATDYRAINFRRTGGHPVWELDSAACGRDSKATGTSCSVSVAGMLGG